MKLQTNQTTKTAYKGKNQAILMGIKEAKEYKSDEWITFVQARKLGRKLVDAKGCGVHLRTFTNERKFNKEKNRVEAESKPISFVVFNSDLLEEEK